MLILLPMYFLLSLSLAKVVPMISMIQEMEIVQIVIYPVQPVAVFF